MIVDPRAATADLVGKSIAVHAFRLLAALVLAVVAQAGTAQAVEVQKVISARGIEAWLVEEDTVPLIAVSFAFVGGAAQDPARLPGVANMLSGLLDEGAGDLDSQAFQSALDEHSIELSFDADRDTFGGSLKTLVENRANAGRLLRLALTEPRFDPEPVERIRAQIIAGIRSDERDPDNVAGEALAAAAFPNHPYGRPVEGTLETVAAITADDLRTFHGKNVARDNLKIAVVGAINSAELAEFLDEVFGSLPVKANLDLVGNVEPIIGERIDIAMNIPQTVLLFAGKGLVRSDPDFVPAAIALRILGGGAFSSRLYEEVREKRGLAYSIGFGLRALDHGGLTVGGTKTRADQADRVVDLIESEIARFASEGVAADELAQAKSYLIGSYASRFTTSTRIARQLLAIQLDDLGIDYIERRNDLIASVTVGDIGRVTQRLFGEGEELTVVRVGQPAS
jgi:zinc protease